MLGGLVLALIGLYFARRVKGQQLADAIEANALYGGRVSFRGSLLISIQTLLSNGFGGSVGLEAGYTQICSMFGSHVGQRLAARRNDMRLLVRQLLVDRFGFQAHTEPTLLASYTLTLASADGTLGPGAKPAAIDCAPGRVEGPREAQARSLCARTGRIRDGVITQEYRE
jgi:hypothetical protein